MIAAGGGLVFMACLSTLFVVASRDKPRYNRMRTWTAGYVVLLFAGGVGLIALGLLIHLFTVLSS